MSHRGCLHAGPQIANAERDAVVVGPGDVVHVDVKIVGIQVERDGTVVEQHSAVGELNLAGLQVQKRIKDRLVAGGLGFWDGLVGAAVLVDDEVDLRLVDVQQREGDVLHCASAACGMSQEVLERDADKDAIGGDVRRLSGTFKAMDDEAIRFYRKVPQAKVNGGEIDLATSGFFQRRHKGFANAILKISRAGIDCQTAEHQQEEQQERAKSPCDRLPHAPPACRCSRGLGGLRIFRLKQAHQGASSPALRMRTLPVSRRLLSQSSSRVLTCRLQQQFFNARRQHIERRRCGVLLFVLRKHSPRVEVLDLFVRNLDTGAEALFDEAENLCTLGEGGSRSSASVKPLEARNFCHPVSEAQSAAAHAGRSFRRSASSASTVVFGVSGCTPRSCCRDQVAVDQPSNGLVACRVAAGGAVWIQTAEALLFFHVGLEDDVVVHDGHEPVDDVTTFRRRLVAIGLRLLSCGGLALCRRFWRNGRGLRSERHGGGKEYQGFEMQGNDAHG